MGRSSSALACASQGRKRESTDQPGERPGTRVSPAGTRVSLRVLVIQTTMALDVSVTATKFRLIELLC